MTTYKLTKWGKTYKIGLTKATYNSNGTLAILMDDLGDNEPFATLTINLDDSNFMANDHMAFIDTNNLGWDIVKWLVDNEIATDTGLKGFSGFCVYPLMMFNQKVLDQIPSAE